MVNAIPGRAASIPNGPRHRRISRRRRRIVCGFRKNSLYSRPTICYNKPRCRPLRAVRRHGSDACAGVAQLVEQLTCNQQVGGSNPSTSSNKKGLSQNDSLKSPEAAPLFCSSVDKILYFRVIVDKSSQKQRTKSEGRSASQKSVLFLACRKLCGLRYNQVTSQPTTLYFMVQLHDIVGHAN